MKNKIIFLKQNGFLKVNERHNYSFKFSNLVNFFFTSFHSLFRFSFSLPFIVVAAFQELFKKVDPISLNWSNFY